MIAWVDLLLNARNPKAFFHLQFLHYQLPRGSQCAYCSSHRVLAHLTSKNKLEENANRARATAFLCLRIDFRMSDHVFSVAKIVPVISLTQSELYARRRGLDLNRPLTKGCTEWNQLICRSLYDILDEHNALRKPRSSVSATLHTAYGMDFRKRLVVITNGLCPRSIGQRTILG